MILTSQTEINVFIISDLTSWHNFLLAVICITWTWGLAELNQVPWVFGSLWDVFSGETSHAVFAFQCARPEHSPPVKAMKNNT